MEDPNNIPELVELHRILQEINLQERKETATTVYIVECPPLSMSYSYDEWNDKNGCCRAFQDAARKLVPDSHGTITEDKPLNFNVTFPTSAECLDFVRAFTRAIKEIYVRPQPPAIPETRGGGFVLGARGPNDGFF